MPGRIFYLRFQYGANVYKEAGFDEEWDEINKKDPEPEPEPPKPVESKKSIEIVRLEAVKLVESKKCIGKACNKKSGH